MKLDLMNLREASDELAEAYALGKISERAWRVAKRAIINHAVKSATKAVGQVPLEIIVKQAEESNFLVAKDAALLRARKIKDGFLNL